MARRARTRVSLDWNVYYIKAARAMQDDNRLAHKQADGVRPWYLSMVVTVLGSEGSRVTVTSTPRCMRQSLRAVMSSSRN